MRSIRWNTDKVHVMEQQLRRAQQVMADAHQQMHQVADSLVRALRIPADIKQDARRQVGLLAEVEEQLSTLCVALNRCDDALSQADARLTARAKAIEQDAHHDAPTKPAFHDWQVVTPAFLKWLSRPIIPSWRAPHQQSPIPATHTLVRWGSLADCLELLHTRTGPGWRAPQQPTSLVPVTFVRWAHMPEHWKSLHTVLDSAGFRRAMRQSAQLPTSSPIFPL